MENSLESEPRAIEDQPSGERYLSNICLTLAEIRTPSKLLAEKKAQVS